MLDSIISNAEQQLLQQTGAAATAIDKQLTAPAATTATSCSGDYDGRLLQGCSPKVYTTSGEFKDHPISTKIHGLSMVIPAVAVRQQRGRKVECD